MEGVETFDVDKYFCDPKGCDIAFRYNWDKIPFVNNTPKQNIIDGRVMRFRGMIQDMPNPVFFYEKYTVKNTQTGQTTVRCGKFRGHLQCNDDETILFDSPDTVSSERRPYYCVPIPALNSWARVEPNTVTENIQSSSGPSNMLKRSVEDMEEGDEMDGHAGQAETKRHCVAESSQCSSGESASSFLLNTDSCIIHVYDKQEVFKVNDVVDVVGFVYVNQTDQDDINIPPSISPRLHVVGMKPTITYNPITPNTNVDSVLADAESIRSELHLVLTQLLFGDNLAADYLICHLLANVYMRQDLTVLGKFSLNLSGVPVDPLYVQGFYDILSLLVPKSLIFPMSLQTMNTANLVPVKDYDTNRLKSGILQLSDRTHLVVDETKLEVGKLEERGVKNVQVLNSLLTEQALNYDFKFYSVPFATNIPVLVFSEGKSLLQCDSHVKLMPDVSFGSSIPEMLEAARAYLKDPLLTAIRTYLAVLSTHEFTLPQTMTQTIESDFVLMMQQNNKITPDEMHSCLVFARLLSLSMGFTSLTSEVWIRAGNMERRRRNRLSI